ncbi:MAG: hypothetical protein IPQ07_45170 [Myxococcales bacterium]|nr:hypothetical protein [Myxococcales bacterium]
MTTEDDVSRLAELSRELPAIDLDATSAERIARRARDDVGKGPSPRRFIEPAIATLLVGGYLVWAIIKVLQLLG